jgi:hypothetical protein
LDTSFPQVLNRFGEVRFGHLVGLRICFSLLAGNSGAIFQSDGKQSVEPKHRSWVGNYPEWFWWHNRDMLKTLAAEGFSLAIEYYREEDGRWLADIAALPGVTAYYRTKKQATVADQALALRLIAGRLEHGEALPGPINVSFIAAHETISELAVRQSADGSGLVASDRLEDQTRVTLAPTAVRIIATKSGLTPKDL